MEGIYLLEIWPCDWGQFIPSIFATFIGFVLALIGEYVFDRHKDKKSTIELCERIKAELECIKEELGKLTEYSLDKNPLKTPVWDEAINVGIISLIPINVRSQLFAIYKRIHELNSWYEIKTNYYFAHFDEKSDDEKSNNYAKRYNEELNQEIKAQERELLGGCKEKVLNLDTVINSISSFLSK